MTGADQPVRPSRRLRRGILVTVALAVVAVGLVVFQPWRLLVDETVDEALPVAASSTGATPTAAASPSTSASVAAASPSTAPASPAGPVELATGTFISHEHATSGTVRLLQLEDGSRVVRIEGLDTSSGPDLRVWLSDQPVVDGPSGWRVFDDGAYADLGSLKGNKGNQNYAVPDDVDLDTLTSLSIWCARFQVSFGAAELRA